MITNAIITNIPVQLVIAFTVDAVYGEPRRLTHPVVYIGRYIEALERALRWRTATPAGEISAGALLVFAAVFTVYAAAFVIEGYALPAFKDFGGVAGVTAYDVMAGILASLTIAQRGLIAEVLNVTRAVAGADAAAARTLLGRIVGRDTGNLNEEEILRAALESLAENASDAIVAPMFYFAIGGLPLAFAYKAVNTIDSMIGYRNDKYLYFGRAGARLDDLANYIPARITGVLIVAGAFLIRSLGALMRGLRSPGALRWGIPGKRGGITKPVRGPESGRVRLDCAAGLRVMLRDGRKHPSPNSGVPEAAAAGVLGVRLGGPSAYGGVLCLKPHIGDDTRKIDPDVVLDAVRITRAAAALALILFAGIRAVLS
jgi:adenosylcobinamide-phosphate synthase